jgi:hypothetical protein
MTRNGKIARLPHDIREQLNLRLDDNEEGQPILDWLNSLPQTRKLLKERFGDVPISKQNLSEWRQGGYREWAIRNELRSKAFSITDSANEIASTIEAPLLAGNLATVLAAQYAKALAEWDGEPTPEIEAKLHVLRIFCRDIALLQRTMYRADTHENEYRQKIKDDDKQEIDEMKEKALAPIMALLQQKYYQSMLPRNEMSEKIAGIIAAIDNNLPVSKIMPAQDASQTKSHQSNPVKPPLPVKAEAGCD